jgi:hypothetical protein
MQTKELTKRPLCRECVKIELTEEEEKLGGTCWFCKANKVVQMAQHDLDNIPLPDTTKHGRPEIDISVYEEAKKQKPPEKDTNVISSDQSSSDINAVSKKSDIKYSSEEVEYFKRNFGIDLSATQKQTDVMVFGTDERTFLHLGLPIPLDTKTKLELREILDNVLMQIANIVLYSRHFKPQLDKLKQSPPGS